MKAIKDVRLSFNEVLLYLGGDRVLPELIIVACSGHGPRGRRARRWTCCAAARSARPAEPIEVAHEVADPESPDSRG